MVAPSGAAGRASATLDIEGILRADAYPSWSVLTLRFERLHHGGAWYLITSNGFLYDMSSVLNNAATSANTDMPLEVQSAVKRIFPAHMELNEWRREASGEPPDSLRWALFVPNGTVKWAPGESFSWGDTIELWIRLPTRINGDDTLQMHMRVACSTRRYGLLWTERHSPKSPRDTLLFADPDPSWRSADSARLLNEICSRVSPHAGSTHP